MTDAEKEDKNWITTAKVSKVLVKIIAVPAIARIAEKDINSRNKVSRFFGSIGLASRINYQLEQMRANGEKKLLFSVLNKSGYSTYEVSQMAAKKVKID